MGCTNPPKEGFLGQKYRQEIRCLATGKVQFINVTEKVTMMQAQVKGPKAAFGKTHTRRKQKGDVIRGRSRQAYKRLLWAIAATAHMFRYGSWFVTLTHGKHAPGWKDSKWMFNCWKYKSCRKFDTLKGVWVAEAQKRGAPHYHLLVTGAGPAAMGWMQLAWLRQTGDEGSDPDARMRHAFDAQVYGESQADAAVEKYLAKLASREMTKRGQQDMEAHTGRTWGYVNREEMKQSVQQIDFMSLSAQEVSEWYVQRCRNALEQRGMNAGAEVVSEDGELIKLCYASTVDFSTNAREFINAHQP